MEIIRDDQKKLIQVWLTSQEKADTQLQDHLKPMYAQWKQQKYLVAVYMSGGQDLYQNTLDLLVYNKRRIAELAVQKEKNAAALES